MTKISHQIQCISKAVALNTIDRSAEQYWAGLLKQQSSNTIHRLPIKEDKLPSSVSVCRKQMEVCRFCFFVCSKRNSPFSVSFVFRLQKWPLNNSVEALQLHLNTQPHWSSGSTVQVGIVNSKFNQLAVFESLRVLTIKSVNLLTKTTAKS